MTLNEIKPRDYDSMIVWIRDNIFQEHVARVVVNTPDVMVIEWRRPNEYNYAMRFILQGYQLIVTGDLGEAVFNLTWKAGLHAFTRVWDGDVSYYLGKLSCSTHAVMDFDLKLAIADTEHYLDDLDIEDSEVRQKVLDSVSEAGSDNVEAFKNGYSHEFEDVADEIGWDCACDLFGVGQHISFFALAWLVGFEMASDYIEVHKLM